MIDRETIMFNPMRTSTAFLILIAIVLAMVGSRGCTDQDARDAALVLEPIAIENGDFEADWGDEENHSVLVVPVSGDPYIAQIGNIFTPPGWVTWFIHAPGSWDQPEVRDAHRSVDPSRVHSGDKAILLFTFSRRHDGGFYQTVDVIPGTRLRLTAWAHAWSNTGLDGYEWCKDVGDCSCGVGFDAACILQGDAPPLSGDPWSDAIQNFVFSVGIDPTGGTNPTASTVVWGRGAHIYNAHAQPPAIEVVTEGESATVFLRSTTAWAFKHNDAYFDDVELYTIPHSTYLPFVLKGSD